MVRQCMLMADALLCNQSVLVGTITMSWDRGPSLPL